MPSKIQGELLPPGWKITEAMKRQVSYFKYYLNDMATLGKLKSHAVRPPIMQTMTKDNSVTLQFSTGAYILAVGPLVKFYKYCEGKNIRKEDVDGLNIIVNSVETRMDAGGKITGYLIQLEVEGETVTVTPFDTQVKMRVQGGKKQEEFTRRALLPFLQNKIQKQSVKIDQINQQFIQLGVTSKSKKSSYGTSFKSSKRGKQPSNQDVPSVFMSEQQLGDSNLVASWLEDQNSSIGSIPNISNVLLMSNFQPEGYIENSVIEIENTTTSSPRRLVKDVEPASRLDIQTLPRSSTPIPSEEENPVSRLLDHLVSMAASPKQTTVTKLICTVPSPEQELMISKEVVSLEKVVNPAGVLDIQKSPPTPMPPLNPTPGPLEGDRPPLIGGWPPLRGVLEEGSLPAKQLDVQKPKFSPMPPFRTPGPPEGDRPPLIGGWPPLSKALEEGGIPAKGLDVEKPEHAHPTSSTISPPPPNNSSPPPDNSSPSDLLSSHALSLSPEAVSFVMPKTPIEPDLPWERVLPADWKDRMGKTMPMDIMRVLLEPLQQLLKPSSEEEQTSVVLQEKPQSAQMEGAASPAGRLEVEDPLGLDTRSQTQGALLEEVIRSAVQQQISARLEGAAIPASKLDTENPLNLDQWRPTHDTTGDVMRFLTEMRKQSSRLESMEKRETNMEQMIKSQSQKIEALQKTLLQVTSRLEVGSQYPQSQGAAVLPQPLPLGAGAGAQPQGAGALNQGQHKGPPTRGIQPPVLASQGARGPKASLPRASDIPVLGPVASLPKALPAQGARDKQRVSQPKHAQGGARAKQQGGDPKPAPAQQREPLKCNTCGHITTSERRMKNHVRNIHTQSQPTSSTRMPVLTLLVGDSHLGSVKRHQLERGLGRGTRLVTPGSTRPAEDRAYCSSADWPGAWFKENTLVRMVPELLGERKYKNMIMMAPTNDISNLGSISNQEERVQLAILSARNTIYVAEQALEKFSYLEEVLIMEQPTRVDDLADLSRLSTVKLRELAHTSPLAGRIRIGSNQSELCTTDEQKTAIFGAPSSHKVDGVHMRGEDGKKFLTKTFVEAAKCAGLADKDSRLGGRRLAAEGLERQEYSWAQVVRGPLPASEVDGQLQQGWGELSNNRYYTLGNERMEQ